MSEALEPLTQAEVAEIDAAYLPFVTFSDWSRELPRAHVWKKRIAELESLSKAIAEEHVQLPDGSLHVYAPVDQTRDEMARLVRELNSGEFAGAHPIIQAAYAHHAFVSIHPFSDGNGRVARALASVYLYRSARIPLLL